jgi:GNAT superfamily N-acetyltransferase
MENSPQLEIQPLTPDRWPDLENLFGKRGAVSGCWCMWWRLQPKDFKLGGAELGEKRKECLKQLTDEGHVPGLLAYHEGQPVGWVSLAPREEYIRLPHTRNWKPLEGEKIWSVVCFFIRKGYRKRGITWLLLEAAIDYAAEHGAAALEAYPKDLHGEKAHDESIFRGYAGMFEKLGFKEIARRHPDAPVMRLELNQKRAT